MNGGATFILLCGRLMSGSCTETQRAPGKAVGMNRGVSLKVPHTFIFYAYSYTIYIFSPSFVNNVSIMSFRTDPFTRPDIPKLEVYGQMEVALGIL